MRKSSKDRVTSDLKTALENSIKLLDEEHERDKSALRAHIDELAARREQTITLRDSVVSAMTKQHNATVKQLNETHEEAIKSVESAFGAERDAIDHEAAALGARLELMESDEKQPKIKVVKS